MRPGKERTRLCSHVAQNDGTGAMLNTDESFFAFQDVVELMLIVVEHLLGCRGQGDEINFRFVVKETTFAYNILVYPNGN